MMDFESVENALYAIREEKYVVLRTFEDFGKKSFLTNHPDIDLLCEDVTAVVQCLHAIPRAKSDDKVHYYVLIGGNKVPVDIRRPGDGYYCETWEKDILAKRVKKDKYYVMDSENYFFSLLYHARIQKASFSNDYINRLIELGRRIGVEFSEIHSVPRI